MTDSIWVYAEKDAPSDDSVVVVSTLVSDSQRVSQGQVVCELEGSKSVFEATAPASGIVYIYFEQGESVLVGQPLFCISNEDSGKPATPVAQSSENHEHSDGDRFSKKALEALLSRGVEPATFRPELDFVTLSDVAPVEDSNVNDSETNGFERIVILGGSFGALLAYEVISTDSSKVAIGVFDDQQNMLEHLGVPLLGGLDKLEIEKHLSSGLFDSVFISIQANSSLREDLAKWTAERGIPLATLVHPRAFISQTARIEEGALIMDGSRVATLTSLGRNVFLSGMVNIDHHCKIGANSTFGPGVFLSGGVTVGSNCSFSSGIVVESHSQIGNGVFVSSGAVIRGNVADGMSIKVRKNTENG